MYFVQLANASKNYGNIIALNNISLKVAKGGVLTLLGPNGSGKTTLLRILACIEDPDNGSLYIDSERVTDGNKAEARLKTTLVFQKTTLFSTSVYNNIAYGLKLRKISKQQIKRTVKETLEKVGLVGYEKRLAKQLSGGEQKRVSLASALALNTPLLLLDEPTANLDPKNASIIEEIIRQANEIKETTIVVATHNFFEARRTSGKAALMIDGRILEVGATKKILNESRNIAEFTRLENVFSGESQVLGEGTSQVALDNGTTIETALPSTGRTTVHIRAEDIILSRTKLKSSARNVFKGKIVEVSDQGPLVKLTVDTGKEFVAQITKRSFVEMGLNVGSQIYLTFKASSVHTL